ncbi:MAG: hypothetical protein M3R36_03945 [Bacteroidota bacterium]|nr:hypothetical protein [Bacteroidota bacterium]
MENNNKFLFLSLKEGNGDYEYFHYSLHTLPDGRTSSAKRYMKNYAKQFYGDLPQSDGDGYYFFGGEVFVQVYSWQFISEEHYNILKQYI